MMFTWMGLSGRTGFRPGSEITIGSIVDGTQFKDGGKKKSKGFNRGQIRGTRGAWRPGDWVKATRGRTMPYGETKICGILERCAPPFLRCESYSKEKCQAKNDTKAHGKEAFSP